MINLKGITWNHSRGITPLQAASQRYAELHPGIEIEWHKRSLQEFADFNIEDLTTQFDLLIIDHPWVGCADATRCVLPLDQYLSKSYLQDQSDNSVGLSHFSYQYGGHQWALAIDAATQMASARMDLFALNHEQVPVRWEELLTLARKGKVAAASIPIDLLMSFYMFCIAHGHEPFQSEEEVIDPETGLAALETMRELWSYFDKKVFTLNPIKIAEWMTSTDDIWYCPFAYGYTNYSRKGYAKKMLTYQPLVQFNKGAILRSTIGGTGLAVSAFSKFPAEAVAFTQWVVSPEIQSTLYVHYGGQPGHRKAWLDVMPNILCNNFFENTLPTMDFGYMRPRYNGYLQFQDHAGDPLHTYLQQGGDEKKVLETFNTYYRASRKNIN